MADFTLSAITAATANPYTPANILIQVGTFKNVNGTGMNAASNGTANQGAHNVAYGGVIQSDITIGATDTGDVIAACVTMKSGANTKKGYCYYVNGTFARLATLDGTGNFVDISGTTFSFTPAATNVITLIYTLATGALVGKVNGTTQSTKTDTTFQTETTMAAGFLVGASNINGSIIQIFQGTGVAGGATPAPRIMLLGVG